MRTEYRLPLLTKPVAEEVRLEMVERGFALVDTPAFCDAGLVLRLKRQKTVLPYHSKRWWKFPQLARYGCWPRHCPGEHSIRCWVKANGCKEEPTSTPSSIPPRCWVKANGCKEEPRTERLPGKVEDGTSIVRKTYGDGKDGAEVVLVIIEGGGHTWPGRQPGVQFLGKSTQNISANDAMWEFFKKHPMK